MNLILVIVLSVFAVNITWVIVGGVKDQWFSPERSEINRNFSIIDRNIKCSIINVSLAILTVISSLLIRLYGH